MKLKERINPTTKVEVLPIAMPSVYVSKEALVKMWTYIDECTEEIGWLGTATKHGSIYHIHDVFLFAQEVHSTTTEITPQGLSDFAMELLEDPNGVEIWNNMKVWGHSHVRMGVSPSGQDNSQMNTFKEGGHDWFIRLIGNKHGEMKIDIYDYANGITFTDVPWEAQITPQEEEIEQQIQQLYLALEEMQKEYSNLYVEPIKEEMKDKVKKKIYTYAQPNTTANKTRSNWWNKSSTTTTQENDTGGTEHVKDEKKTSEKSVGRNAELDMLENDDDVSEYFAFNELWEFAECEDLNEVQQIVEEYGYFQFFTENDIERIYRVAIKRCGNLSQFRNDGGYYYGK